METANAVKCAICGEEFLPVAKLPERVRSNAPFPFCENCQQKIYSYLVALPGVGYKVAVFLACLFFNVPYLPEVAAEAAKFSKVSKGKWKAYLMALRAWNREDHTESAAVDGITDIRKAFDGEMKTLQVSDDMLSAEDYKSLERIRKERWGDGPTDEPYTQTDYEAMDKTYASLTEDRAYVSAQAEAAIVRIAKWTLAQDRCFVKQDYDSAKKIGNLIKEEKEGEQLRKKDELPQDRVRLDDIVQAVERAGLHIMDYDELCKELATKAFHAPYPYWRDAADQMLLAIRNCTAWNEGQEEVDRLPDAYAIQDTLGEFATENDEKGQQIYRDLGILPLDMPQKDDS